MKTLFWTALVWTYGTLVWGQAPPGFVCPPGMQCFPAPGNTLGQPPPLVYGQRPAVQEFVTPGQNAFQPGQPAFAVPVEDDTIEINFRQRGGVWGRRQTIQIIVQNRQPPVFFQAPPQFQTYAAPPQFAFQPQQQFAPQFQPQQFAEPRLQWQPSSVCFGGNCFPLR